MKILTYFRHILQQTQKQNKTKKKPNIVFYRI